MTVLKRVATKGINCLGIDVHSIPTGGATPAFISLFHESVEQPAQRNYHYNKYQFFQSAISVSDVPNVQNHWPARLFAQVQWIAVLYMEFLGRTSDPGEVFSKPMIEASS